MSTLQIILATAAVVSVLFSFVESFMVVKWTMKKDPLQEMRWRLRELNSLITAALLGLGILLS